MAADLTSAYAHCEALVREAEHEGWLAALFAPAERRPSLHALAAFAIELARVRDRVRQPLAGEIRLQWWRDALEADPVGDVAGHPVAAALLDTLSRGDLSRGTLLDALEAHRVDLYRDDWAGVGELEGFLDATRGASIRLAAALLAGPEANGGEAARHAGIAEGIAAIVVGLPRVTSGGRVDIPRDVLGRHGLMPDALRAGQVTPAVRAALADFRALARRHLAALRAARRDVPPGAGPAFLTVNLVEPTLRASERLADPFAAAADISPWRRHWILWRAARHGGVR